MLNRFGTIDLIILHISEAQSQQNYNFPTCMYVIMCLQFKIISHD